VGNYHATNVILPISCYLVYKHQRKSDIKNPRLKNTNEGSINYTLLAGLDR